MEIAVCIFYIIFGIICALIGFIATIVCFSCPIEHLWTIPLLLVGILFTYSASTDLLDIKVNEKINNNIVYENIVVEKCNCGIKNWNGTEILER